MEIAVTEIPCGSDRLRKRKGWPGKGRAYLRAKYPGAFPLSESQIEVLEGLAREGPTNAYRLTQKIDKAYSFVFNSLRELERRKMVFLKREEVTEKGTKAKIYALNLEGILLVLYREMRYASRDNWDKRFIRKIVESHGSLLPLVFGKWKYLKEMGFGEIFLTRLKIIVDTHESNPFRKGTGFYRWLETREQITRFFFLFDLWRLDNHFIKNFDAKAWMTALKQDKEIRNYLIKELKYEQRRLKNAKNYVEGILSFMEPQQKKED